MQSRFQIVRSNEIQQEIQPNRHFSILWAFVDLLMVSESTPSAPSSIYIAPEHGPWLASLRELWSYRELLYYLAWRELKTRYMQTALGAAWVILQPLAMMLIFTLFFGLLARVPADGIPYPVFYYSSLLLWIFFTNTLSSTSNSLVGNAQLVTKVFFPRLALPLSSLAARLVDFGVALVALALLMIFYRTPLTIHLVVAPFIVAIAAVLAFSLGLLFAAWNVRYRDVGHMLPLVIQIWMFASPIIYSTRLVPKQWQSFYMLNPLVGILDNFRAALFGLPFDWASLGVTVLITLLVLMLAVQVFRRMEDTFADVI
jgi:lipopolysaccharide transport system permease protein